MRGSFDGMTKTKILVRQNVRHSQRFRSDTDQRGNEPGSGCIGLMYLHMQFYCIVARKDHTTFVVFFLNISKGIDAVSKKSVGLYIYIVTTNHRSAKHGSSCAIFLYWSEVSYTFFCSQF
jgi:hypothetical protein